MDCNKDIPLKVYLQHEDFEEQVIRRFSICFPSSVGSYNFLVNKIGVIFPELSGKMFAVTWKDEEGDEVALSSDEELALAMQSAKVAKVMKFYVRVQSPLVNPKKGENEPVHLGVYCDGCEQNISGVRYKCGICSDYDLCRHCRESDIHVEHPMFRIPYPADFNQTFGIGVTLGKHKSRVRSDGGKKKRKIDRRESGPETGDESEEMHHGKYFHKKCKKAYKCPYSQMMNDLLGYFNPIYFHPRQSDSQNSNKTANRTDVPSHVSYLKNLGSSLQKILDPLGVSVEFEVRPKGETKEEKKKENQKEDEKHQPGESSPSAPPQKEVRFGANEEFPETMMQKIEEITKILSSQSMNSGSDNDNGWVSFEELKKDSEEPQPSNSKEAAKTSQAQTSAPEEKEAEATAAETAARENQNLYPNLTSGVSSNPAVRAALEKMLGMGFTNEGNWLSSLLEAKNGDIDQALESLSFQKRVGK